jgi:hypothetical protein
MLGLSPILVGLLMLIMAACGRPEAAAKLAVPVPQEIVPPRPQYDVSRPFAEIVRPHFYARSSSGELADVEGKPDLVLERDGKVKVRLKQGSREQYLDILALESELLGEHPMHKVLRLHAMGVPIDPGLEVKLRTPSAAEGLFHTLRFEHLPGKEASGVITDVFPDGSFLVIPSELPQEWQSSRDGVSAPTHFHVDPRALIARESGLAKEYEQEILALPFDDQRYPPAPLAQKQCQLYKDSLQGAAYTELLDSVGYRFTQSHVLKDTDGKPFGEKLVAVLWQGAGKGTQYFGFEGEWVAERLSELGVSWIGDCDTAGGVRRYRANGSDRDSFYITVRRSLEPDKRQRHRIVALGDDGSGQEVYRSPGIILMSRPLPFNPDYWLVSNEGWDAPGNGGPGDPRWQSVYVVNLKNPDEYYVAEYPTAQYPKPSKNGHLYGGSDMLVADAKYLINTLYGFEHEGGGIWLADLSDERFYEKPESFARIVAWDHSLSSLLLKSDVNGDSTSLFFFLTGKEVADQFAMTANILRIRLSGLKSEVERKERLLQMVGWNPVPFAWQRTSDNEFRVGVETYYNYESSLLPRAQAVYFVSVDTR